MKKILILSIILFFSNMMYAQEPMVIEIGDLKPQFRNIKTEKASVQKSIQESEFQFYSDNKPAQNANDTKLKYQVQEVQDPRSLHEMVLATNLVKLTSGEPFTYPLKEGSVLECYAKRIDGSIDGYIEYNDYFYMKHDGLYSNTLHKLYKPEKANELKKVDGVSVKGETLKLYDPLWEPSLRRHKRNIKINMKTGEYYMYATQDNAMWYRKAIATGYCRVNK